ncbi:MAG: NADH-quinone oxidoreductase subunit J [Candidatus Micrarchaeia archaeon]
MYEFIFLILFSFIIIISGIFIFYQKSIMRAVLMLTIAFGSSALIFFALGQNFIGLLQLFIFVGGMSTYLIVAVSSEYKKIENLDFLKITMIAAILFVSIFLSLYGIGNSASNNIDMSRYFSSALENYYPILYMAIIILFLTAIGSVIIIRKYVKLII